MQVELKNIDEIKPYDRNPRLNDAAVDAVAITIHDAEVWLPIPGYETLYVVSSYGRVLRRSKSRMASAGHPMKFRYTQDGYIRYSLFKNNHYWHVTAHRLVALAFLGPPPFSGAQVAHYDGNKLNNHLSNLRWASAKENEADKKRHGTMRGALPGESHPMSKLTVKKVREIRRLALSGVRITDVARQMNIAKLTAYDAIVGNTWKTITEPPPILCKRRTAK